jgi:biotin carboxyl carrier protein
MNFTYLQNSTPISITLDKDGARYRLIIGENTYVVDSAELREGELRFIVDGQSYRAYVAASGNQRWVAFDSTVQTFTVPDTSRKARRGSKASGHDTLEAQMPGVVRKVLVSVGDKVEKGQVLLVLEAMKMEIKIAAPHAGSVEKLGVKEGETVQRGQLLVEVEAE